MMEEEVMREEIAIKKGQVVVRVSSAEWCTMGRGRAEREVGEEKYITELEE